MTLDSTDARIKHAVEVIGRSEDRRKVFEEIYYGKSKGKRAKEVADAIGMDEKRVLEVALALSRANIIEKKKVSGRLEYSKIEIYYVHKGKILRYLDDENAKKKFLNSEKTSPREDKPPIEFKKIRRLPTKRLINIKILFLTANPRNSTRLRLDEEAREIENRIALAQKKNEFLLIKKGAVRTSDLQLYLNQEKPVIVHFSGHGSEEKRIVLEDNLGNAVEVSTEALERVFQALKDNIRCVVLNACFSLEQAKAINQNIDFVIGMSDSINDSAAIAFSYAFYLALASGRSIKNSFDQGLAEILLAGQSGEDKKVNLLCRDNLDATKAFIL